MTLDFTAGAYVPRLRARDLWGAPDDGAEREPLVNLAARRLWAARTTKADDDDDDDEDDNVPVLSDGRDRLVQIAFSTEPLSLIDTLPSKKKDPRTGAA